MSFTDGSDWSPRRRTPGGEDPLEALRAFADRWREFTARFGPWTILGVLLALWAVSGVYTVAPDERAVVLRFGRAVREAEPGPHYRLPRPIEQTIKVPVTTVRKEELGFRTISPGPPARYQQLDAEALMLTGDNNIVELDFIVQYRVATAADGLTDFLFNVADAPQAVRDASEAAMREVIGSSRIDEALTEGKERIQADTEALLQHILAHYDAGVEVLTVKLQDVGPPRAVSDAFKDVISAEQDKERLINEARGYANDVVPKARGEAAQLVNDALAYRETKVREAEGAARRFLSVYEEYDRAREVTRRRLYLETMEQILPRLNTVLVDESVGRQILPFLPLPGHGGTQAEPGGAAQAGATSGAGN